MASEEQITNFYFVTQRKVLSACPYKEYAKPQRRIKIEH